MSKPNVTVKVNNTAPRTTPTPGVSRDVAHKSARMTSSSATESRGATPAAKGIVDRVSEAVPQAKPFLEKNGHALVYGIIGLIAAILILTIGLLPVLLLAALSAIGVAIGRYRDGDATMRNATGSLARLIGR